VSRRNTNPGNYNLYGRNCARFAEDVLRTGGLHPLNMTCPQELANDLRDRLPRLNTHR